MVKQTAIHGIEQSRTRCGAAALSGAGIAAPPRAAEAAAPHRRRIQRGFTLIELLVVVTIVGILAAVAVVNVKYAQRKAREAALMDDLKKMRESIDNFYADKQRYPNDLNELVPHYLKRIPKDPVSNADDWEPVMDAPDPNAPPETDPTGNPLQPGVVDVKSKAPGTTLDNVPYTDL